MRIVATFKGRLLVIELLNRLNHSKTETKKLFLSHGSIVTLLTSTVVKSRTNAVFSLLQLCRGVCPGPWHCTAAVATQMTASMANALTWCASHCNSTSSVPQSARELLWFNDHLPLFMHRQWVSLFCLFWQVMWSNRNTRKRNDAGPFPLAGLSLAQRTWAAWLRVQRGRVGVAEESHSQCALLCCLWSLHVSPQTSHLCSWSPGLTPVQFRGVTLALYHRRGMESCCGGRWVSQAVYLPSPSTMLLQCRLLLTSTWQPASNRKGSRSAERIRNVFLHKGQHLKGIFSSCFIKAAYRTMKSQTLIIIQFISLFKPAKLKVAERPLIFATYFLYLAVAKKK